ncbi:MAG: LytR C-terminal domain-containing protein [Candidatus Andersenbacteria bacterium]|nr:LytR C-terminal domain-containing protein [Candidatus Andersenbacteria bacterium]
MNDHLASFPRGTGKLLWRAYLEESTATLDGLTIGYTTSADSSTLTTAATPTIFTLSSGLAQSVNRLFSLVHSRTPTFSEWRYWGDRVIAGDKDGQPALLGAMQWQRLFGGGTAGTAQVAGISTSGPTVEIRNGTNEQGLAKRTLGKLTEQGYAVTVAANAQGFLRETSKVYVIDHGAYSTAQELADTLAIPVGLDVSVGEESTEADILLILGYD